MRHKDNDLMARILEYINQYALEHNGETPSTTVIAKGTRSSQSTISRYLIAMDELGMLRYDHGQIGTAQTDKICTWNSLAPVSGSVPCGSPEEIEEDIEEYISLPATLTGGGNGEYFILRASGDSMVDVGIDDGDLVIVRKQPDAYAGEIVAAFINEGDERGSTLKVKKEDEDGIEYLWAMNSTWTDEERRINIREYYIQGVAIRVIKNIEGRYD